MTMMNVGPDGAVTVKPEAAEQIRDHIAQLNRAVDEELLLKVPFVTVHDYMYLLRSAGQAIAKAGKTGMLYLAAAVSDFYVPFEEMAEHKMQSSAGPPDIKLTNSPKMLMPLRHVWAPESFVVTFKLETDESILVKKAQGSIQKYGMDLVIANLLMTRKEQVTFIKANDSRTILRGDVEEIEERMILELKAEHEQFCGRSFATEEPTVVPIDTPPNGERFGYYPFGK